MMIERHFGVWLRELRVGTLVQRGDHTRFALAESYLSDAGRPVLGLAFEQDLRARYAAALRLPVWFSNLLPEGTLREWIAAERHVSVQREMELLAQVGHDLPGAVRIRPVEPDDTGEDDTWETASVEIDPDRNATARWTFSLAGVALKFSMLAAQDRLTVPAAGVGGDWIVKLPDRTYSHVPQNEFAMMSLARAAGIETPDVRLVHRDEVDGLPKGVWPETEEWAYAVRRFDRRADRTLVHIEDLAQVRGFYPEQKYAGNYETVAALVYRGHDVESLRELTRRMVLNVLIANGDAHLKNWSLIYEDERVPRLAPAYDLVSTRHYMGQDQEQALKFGGSRRPSQLRLAFFDILDHKLRAQADLVDVARTTIEAVRTSWPEAAALLTMDTRLRDDIADSVHSMGTLLSRPA